MGEASVFNSKGFEMVFAILLVLGSSVQEEVSWVDVIEVNQIIKEDEKVALTQVIYWRWERDGRLHVVAWKTVPEDFVVYCVRGVWIDDFKDAKIKRKVYGRGFRFRRSGYDPEIQDRVLWTEQNRQW